MPELASKTVTWGDVRVVIHEATALDEARRMRLQGEVFAETDDDRRAARWMYADCAAAADSRMPFEEWLTLPGAFVDAWRLAVMELNPHWFGLQSPAEEKKLPTPFTNAS